MYVNAFARSCLCERPSIAGRFADQFAKHVRPGDARNPLLLDHLTSLQLHRPFIPVRNTATSDLIVLFTSSRTCEARQSSGEKDRFSVANVAAFRTRITRDIGRHDDLAGADYRRSAFP